jgi:hypothetical protein
VPILLPEAQRGRNGYEVGSNAGGSLANTYLYKPYWQQFSVFIQYITVYDQVCFCGGVSDLPLTSYKVMFCMGVKLGFEVFAVMKYHIAFFWFMTLLFFVVAITASKCKT